jgi:hypothetical protein
MRPISLWFSPLSSSLISSCCNTQSTIDRLRCHRDFQSSEYDSHHSSSTQNQGVEQYVKCADAWAPTAATNEWPPPLASLSSSTVPGSDRLISRSPSEQLSRVTILLLFLGVFCFVHRFCPSLRFRHFPHVRALTRSVRVHFLTVSKRPGD